MADLRVKRRFSGLKGVGKAALWTRKRRVPASSATKYHCNTRTRLDWVSLRVVATVLCRRVLFVWHAPGRHGDRAPWLQPELAAHSFGTRSKVGMPLRGIPLLVWWEGTSCIAQRYLPAKSGSASERHPYLGHDLRASPVREIDTNKVCFKLPLPATRPARARTLRAVPPPVGPSRSFAPRAPSARPPRTSCANHPRRNLRWLP